MAEGQAGLEPLHQSEYVALGVAGWIPPAASSVANDQDLAFASSVLQAELRALLPIQFPGWRRSLQHDAAMHFVAQFVDFGIVVRSCPLLAFERRSWAGIPLAFLAPALPANREAVALQGRAVRAGACDTPLSARPTLAVAIPTSSHLKRRLCGIGANKKLEPARRQRQKECAVPPAEKMSHAGSMGSREAQLKTCSGRSSFLAVAISAPSLLTRSWTKPARTENAAEKQGRSTGQITPTGARDFPSRRAGPVSPLSSAVRIRPELTLAGDNWKEGTARRRM